MQVRSFAHTVALLSALVMTASSAQADATLTAGSCTGIDTVLVLDPPLPPAIITDPVTSAEQFSTLSFEECVSAANGAIKACAVTESRWVGLGANLAAEGFEMSGQLNVAKPTLADTATSKQARTITFVISGAGAAPGNKYYLELAGTRGGTLPAGVVSTECTLKGPTGNIIFTSDAGTFTHQLAVGNGTFTLILSAEAVLDSSDAATNGILTYDVALNTLVPTCGLPFAGNCDSVHSSPACNDAACCELVCSIDATCCEQSWDADCVAFAAAGCAGLEPITGAVYDPHARRFTQLFSPAFWWHAKEQSTTAAPLLVVQDAAHDEWTRRNVLDDGAPESLPVWIGLSDAASEGAFQWVDGSPLTYSDWLPGQPANGDYVALDAGADGWLALDSHAVLPSAISWVPDACGTDADCAEVHEEPGCSDHHCCMAVCQVDPYCCMGTWDDLCVSRASELCAETTLSGPFINPANRHRYYVVSPTAWMNATDIAFAMGGTLAVPDTEAESDWMWHNLLDHSTSVPTAQRRAWIGVDAQLFTNEYRNAFGEVPSFFDWMPGEPERSWTHTFVRLRAIGDTEQGTWDTTTGGAAALGLIELSCEGDLNDDGDVSAADLGVLLGSWQAPAADLTGDGTTDAADLSILLGLWGPCPSSNACSARATPGSDLPGCTTCVCNLAPACCEVAWDATCVSIATFGCDGSCQCGG